MSEAARLLSSHPHWSAASRVVETLTRAGHRTLFAGGCVRDALLGVTAQDLDLATAAQPDQIAALFEKTVDVGKSFGVMRVLIDGVDLEVATFRADGEYRDGRRPESVQYSDEREDAFRRDFTVNALFWDPSQDQVIDFVDGQRDLRARSLRAVGDPRRRFAEDHLRVLRAVRFAVQLGFSIEAATWLAVQEMAPKTATVSRERIRDEMGKMLKRGGGDKGPALLQEAGLNEVLFPELAPFARDLIAGAVFLRRPSLDGPSALVRWLAPVALKGGREARGAIEATLRSLRLSSADERFAMAALRALVEGDSFWAKTRGRQILEYDDPARRFAFDLEEELGREKDRRRRLHDVWSAFTEAGAKALPARLVRGHDASAKIQGAELGRLLEQAYEAQLEGVFSTREEALTWLAKRLQN